MNIVEMMKNPLFKKGFDIGFATKPVMLAEDEFNEDDHPRDENGRFSSESGGGESGGSGFSKMSTDDKEDYIIEALGHEEALNATTQAMSRDDKIDIYPYILDTYDLDFDEETGETTVDRNDVNAMENHIIDSLGSEKAFTAISQAMSYDQKDDIYNFIGRTYDLDYDEDE